MLFLANKDDFTYFFVFVQKFFICFLESTKYLPTFAALSKHFPSMISQTIYNQMKAQGVGYKALGAAVGIEPDKIKRFVHHEVELTFNEIIPILDALNIGFGYKEVGVALEPANNLREKIRSILDNRGIRLRDLAILCDVNYCTLSSWMNGKRQLRCQHLEKVLCSLGLASMRIIN